jgi:hypothetical protein
MNNKIATKRLKRKRKLAQRMKCHQSKDPCSRVHPLKKAVYVPPVFVVEDKKKPTLLSKIKSWISQNFR